VSKRFHSVFFTSFKLQSQFEAGDCDENVPDDA